MYNPLTEWIRYDFNDCWEKYDGKPQEEEEEDQKRTTRGSSHISTPSFSVAVHETLVAEGCAAMASEFCMQVAALLRGSAAPGSLKRAFDMYETVAKTTPEDFRAYLEMGNMR